MSNISIKNDVIYECTNLNNEYVDKTTLKQDDKIYDTIDMCTCSQGPCSFQEACRTGKTVFAVQNIRSLLPKIDQIKWFLKQHPIDFLCINETWLTDSIDNAEIFIEGYNIVRKDRNSCESSINKKRKTVGGGVLIYVKDTFSYKIRDDLAHNDIECLWIEIKSPGIPPFLVSTFYRPPSVNKEYDNNIKSNIEQAGLDSKHMYILGDFNVDYAKNVSNLITSIEEIHNLTQIVHFNTRVTPVSATCIDLIMTSNSEIHTVTKPLKLGLSDHYMVYTIVNLKIKTPNVNHKYTTFRSYKKFDETAFLTDVKESFINFKLDKSDMEASWDTWKIEFLKICDKHAPIRKMRVKNENIPWIDNEIRDKMYERDYKHKKAVSTKNDAIWNQYKKLRNEVTGLMRKKKKDYYVTKLESSKNSKDMWKAMNNIIPNKKNNNLIPPEMNANSFNEYFAKIGLSLADKHKDLNLPWKNPEIIHHFKLTELTTECLMKRLRGLPEKSNLDVLGFDTKLLRISGGFICDSLCSLINLSFATGVVPNDWKLARVTPVYKGDGDVLSETNYRPISVIGHIVKFAESEVKEQLLNYLLFNELITVDQSAYLKNHSTITCLHRVIGDWQEAIDDGEMIGACFLDISKCFDSIDHKLLITKLEKYGISGTELKWFTSYLTDRTQRVICNNILSTDQTVQIGVPQGSILGPILFLIYINDLTQFSGQSQCNLFADDALFYVHGKDLETINTKLQKSMDNVSLWYKCNKLTLNVKKSNIMLIHRRKNINGNINVTINGAKLQQTDNVKYLGLYIDNKLQWHNHINNLCKTITKKLGMMNRTSKFVNKSTLIQMYKSFIMPSLDYADTIWSGCSKFLQHKLQVLQNRAARIIEQNFDFINTRGLDLITKLHLQTTVDRRNFRICTMIYKCIHGKVPHYLSDQIIMACDIHKYGTRQAESMSIYVKPARSDCLRKSIFHLGASLWNNLPNKVKESETILSFKKNYLKSVNK